MAIYKIATGTITVPAAEATGTIIAPTITALATETFSLMSGTIANATEGTAVVLYETVGAGEPAQVAISYTDATGEFGIPYEFVTGNTYNLKVFTPNTL